MFGHYSESNRKGFTLIELLVVIAIIALLSTLAVVSFSSARARARDAVRVSNLTQVKTALEFVRGATNEYPLAPTGNIMGTVAVSDCLDNKGFVNATVPGDCTKGAPLEQVQDDPQAPSQHYKYYAFTETGSGCAQSTDQCENYMITFKLEGDMAGGYKQGWNCTKSGGVKSYPVATEVTDIKDCK